MFSASIHRSLLGRNWHIVGQILHDLSVVELQKVHSTAGKLQFAGTCWIFIDSIVLWILLGLRFDSIVFWMGQQIPTGPIHSHSVSGQLGS